jgi:hypothetical protein
VHAMANATHLRFAAAIVALGSFHIILGSDVQKDVSARSPLTAGLQPSNLPDEAPSRLGQSRGTIALLSILIFIQRIFDRFRSANRSVSLFRRRRFVGPVKRRQAMQSAARKTILFAVTIRRRRIGVRLDLAAPHSLGRSNERMQRKPCASLTCNFIRATWLVFYVSSKTCRRDSLLMRSLLIIVALLGLLFKVFLLLGVVFPVIFCTSILRLFVRCGGCFHDSYQAAYSSSLQSPSPAEDVTRVGASIYIRDHGSELTSPRAQPSGKDRSYSNCCLQLAILSCLPAQARSRVHERWYHAWDNDACTGIDTDYQGCKNLKTTLAVLDSMRIHVRILYRGEGPFHGKWCVLGHSTGHWIGSFLYDADSCHVYTLHGALAWILFPPSSFQNFVHALRVGAPKRDVAKWKIQFERLQFWSQVNGILPRSGSRALSAEENN